MNRKAQYRVGLELILALVSARSATAGCEVTKLPDPVDKIAAVAIDKDFIVTGAQYSTGVAPFTGAAVVHRYETGTWGPFARLRAPDGEYDDRFGCSVAIGDDVVVVGAKGDDHHGILVGSAYVFRFDGRSKWIYEAKLVPPDGAFADLFGNSVAISGDVIVVGAYQDDDGGDDSGSAYVYRHDGMQWRLEAKLTGSDAGDGANFGFSVAVEDDVAVIGARDFFNGGPGAAYIFRFGGTAWIEEARLLAADGADLDFFGWDVDVSGNTVIVGAQGNDDFGTFTGSAYVFTFDGMGWDDGQKLLPDMPARQGRFGRTVSVSGDLAIVGALGDDPTGSVTVFRRNDGAWIWNERLEASNGSVGDQFAAHSIAIQGDVAVVSARDHHDGDIVGPAFVFAGLTSADCDDDGTPDACEIAAGSSDRNGNRVPDSCEISDREGATDCLDAVLRDLGPCDDPSRCPSDMNGDGLVDALDILISATRLASNP